MLVLAFLQYIIIIQNNLYWIGLQQSSELDLKGCSIKHLLNFTFLIIFKMMEIYTIFWNMYNWKSGKNCIKITRLQNMNKLKLWPYSFTEHNIAILYPIKLCFKKQFWKYDSRQKIFYIRGLKYEKCNSVVHLGVHL